MAIHQVRQHLPERIQRRQHSFDAVEKAGQLSVADINVNEVTMKRAMVDRCRQVVEVLDSQKWGKVVANTFAHLKPIDILITDHDAPEDIVYQN